MGRMIGNALAGHQGDMQGVALDPEAWKIPDAEKYRGQAQTQYDTADSQRALLQPKQNAFLDALGQQAAGQGPSLAVEQLKQAQNRNLAQQMAAVQNARSGNPAMLQRQLMQQNAASQQNLAAQSTQARMQEQQSAQAMYGNQLNGMQQNANQQVQQYLSQGFSMAQAQQQAAVDFQKTSMQQALGLAGINAGIQSANHAQDVSAINNQIGDIQKFATMGMMGGGGGGASAPSASSGGGGSSYLGGNQMSSQLGMSQFMGGGGMMSDENQKVDIKSSTKQLKGFLDKLSEKSYNYKDTNKPGTADGKRFGIIAQDLEKSEAGKSIVRNTVHGKMVDTQQGFGLALGALAHLNKRLAKLEK